MTWLSVKELADLMGTYPKKAQRWAKKNAETRYMQGRGGKGGKVLQVSLESLPQDLQKKHLAARAEYSENIPEKIPARSTTPFRRGGPIPPAPKADIIPMRPAPAAETKPQKTETKCPKSETHDASPDKKPRRLTREQERLALARADLVRFVRERKAAAKKEGRSKTQGAEDAMALYNNGFILQDVLNVLGKVHLKTVYAWDRKLRRADGDYAALATLYGHGRGESRLTEMEREIFLREMLTPNRPKIGTAITWTRTVLRSQYGIVSGASDASYRRFAEHYKAENHHIWVLARQGEKALDDKVLPYIERDRSLIEVGDVLVADGHPLNFQVLNPWTGKPCRATLVVFFDWRSAFPCGFEIKLTEDVQCIQSAFRRAVLTLGKLPRQVLIDNGKAFKARVFTSQVDLEGAGIYGLYARLGVDVRFSRAYNAKDKPVERFFGTLSELVERKMPSYVGASIDDKPAYMLRNEKFHRSMHNPVVPTIEQAVRLIQAGLEMYARQPHGGLEGATPLEVFQAGRGPGADPGELNHMMMSVDVRTIRRNGVKMFGGHYWDDALVGLKKSVIVRYDFQDLGHILVYDHEGEFLCKAERTYRYDPLMRGEDYAALKQAMKDRGVIKKNITKAVRALHGRTEELPAIDWQSAVDAVPELPEAMEAAAAEARTEEPLQGLRGAGVPLTYPPKESEAPDIEERETLFEEMYERYEYLRGKASLSEEERSWMAEYEKTEEYKTIFMDLGRQAL